MQLILLGTSACHLCEQAEALVADYLSEAPIPLVIDRIDIAEEMQWQEQFALRIPVLFARQSGRALCWPFDKSKIEVFIRELKNDRN